MGMEFFDRLDTLIRAQNRYNSQTSATEVLAQISTPSVSIAVLDHGTISTKSFSTVGNDSDTVYQACSISKPVAAMAVMKLIQQGKLQLDTPITEYLSVKSLDLISVPSTRELIEHITLRQLMSHTSGLSQGGFNGYVENPPDIQTVLAGSATANSLHVHLTGLPGHRFSYAGGGITVIQLTMEEVTGRSFADLVHELVLVPLGMTRSFYRPPTATGNFASAFMTGYTPCDVKYHVFTEMAAGGLWTTPKDLLLVVKAVQHSLVSDDDSGFIPKSLAREMLTEVSSGMALSWLAPKDPGCVFGHGGSNNPGYRCQVIGFADVTGKGNLDPALENSGICIMTNSAEGALVYEKLIQAILHLKGWPDIGETDHLPQIIIPFRAHETKIVADWESWRGSWGDVWKLDGPEDAPMLSFQGLPPIRLLPAARPRKGDAVDLLLDGLEIMLRLMEQEGEKVVEVWHGGRREKEILYRNQKAP